MSKKSSPQLVTAGLLVIAVLVAALIWKPMRADVTALSADLTAQQTELATSQAELASLTGLESKIPTAEVEREKLLTLVPEGLNEDALVKQLSAIAKTVGVSLTSMSFSLQNAQTDGANTVTISANFIGYYNSLISLLQALENSSRLFKVSSVGVQLGEVTEAGYLMTFNVSLEAYYQ
ncbi:MAG: type 4a pilus biogenesis protein PilO [Candidatus Gracilibacteria bacterium]